MIGNAPRIRSLVVTMEVEKQREGAHSQRRSTLQRVSNVIDVDAAGDVVQQAAPLL